MLLKHCPFQNAGNGAGNISAEHARHRSNRFSGFREKNGSQIRDSRKRIQIRVHMSLSRGYPKSDLTSIGRVIYCAAMHTRIF